MGKYARVKPENPAGFLRRRPRALRGAGAPCLAPQASEPFGFLGGRRTRRAVSPLFVFLLTIKCLTHFVETPKLGVSTDKIKPPSTFIVVETR